MRGAVARLGQRLTSARGSAFARDEFATTGPRSGAAAAQQEDRSEAGVLHQHGHLVAGKRVYVAGAGLGGLAFGLSLLKSCKEQGISPLPDVRFFERDASAEARARAGYSMGISGGGLQALHRMGVLEACLQHLEPGDSANLATPSFRVLASFKYPPAPAGLPLGNLRINRSNLRQTLLKHFPESSVSYGKICVGALGGKDGSPLQLTFQDGSSQECDILVAADGVNSKLRASILPDEQPRYSGFVLLGGHTGKLEFFPELLSRGQVIAPSAAGVSFFMSASQKESAHWSFSWSAPESTAAELNRLLRDPSTAKQVAELALAKGAPYAEPWPTLWRNTSLDALWASALMDKDPHSNTDTAPVIFIGDSCHPMTPFSGNGAAMAFCDAWQLAQQLTEPRHATLREAVAAYDAESGPRALEPVVAGRRNMGIAHAGGMRRRLLLTFVFILGSFLRLGRAVNRVLGR